MEWHNCYQATNQQKANIDRSQYQRDFDRLIFSSSFRRLQNKTQVFPLPGTSFVHNRLTHSLEVASVGRSLGSLVGKKIAAIHCEGKYPEAASFFNYELSNVIAAGCLAHDIGNPAFGHSGEAAISNYFQTFENQNIEGTNLKAFYSSVEWGDLINFEGNANAFRILTQAFKGKSEIGMGITPATLAAILKYPCGSDGVNKSKKHTKKYSFFQTERDIFEKLAETLSLKKESADPLVYCRHPFVYLVEAADDICYNIIDMEDAHRISLLSKDLVGEAFLNVIQELNHDDDNLSSIRQRFFNISDDNESIAYLRSKCINSLTNACADIFLTYENEIINTRFDTSLFSILEKTCPAIKHIEEISLNRIYRHHNILEIEIAGFNILSGLLELYIPAVLREFKSPIDKTILRLIPKQFDVDMEQSAYLRTMSVLDHISGMTDAYALEHYRKLKGIQMTTGI